MTSDNDTKARWRYARSLSRSQLESGYVMYQQMSSQQSQQLYEIKSEIDTLESLKELNSILTEELEEAYRVLQLIAEGFYNHSYEGRYVIVDNPLFKQDNGESLFITFDTWR